MKSILKVYEIDGKFYPDQNQVAVFDHFSDGSESLNKLGMDKMKTVAEAHGWEVQVWPV